MFFAKPNYEMNPYYTLEYSNPNPKDEIIEPIDEEEIYGKSIYSWTLFRFAYPSNLLRYRSQYARNGVSQYISMSFHFQTIRG